MSNPNAISEYLRKPESIERFSEVLGTAGRANRYIQSVLIAVSTSDDLMKCTPRSILSAALRCASLQLSCDPATRQGQLVPFKNFKTGEMEAALIIHYVGLTILAERTNKYRVINVREVYEGWQVMENIYTGLHAIEIPGLGILSDGYMPRWNMKETPVVGYLGYFETMRGFKKSIYMTIEEIEQHARSFSKGYNSPKSLWKDPKHLPTMRMKTVLRALAKWMDLGSSNDALTQALEDFDGDPYDYDTVDNGNPVTGEIIEGEKPTEESLLAELGIESAKNGKADEPTPDWIQAGDGELHTPQVTKDLSKPDTWPKAWRVQIVQKERAAQSDHEAAGMLSKSQVIRPDKPLTPALVGQWAKTYRAARDEGKSPEDAATEADGLAFTPTGN